jgi:arylsulfatase A-like enzyme
MRSDLLCGIAAVSLALFVPSLLSGCDDDDNTVDVSTDATTTTPSLGVITHAVSGALKVEFTDDPSAILADTKARQVVEDSAQETIAEASNVGTAYVAITNMTVATRRLGRSLGSHGGSLKVDYEISAGSATTANQAQTAMAGLNMTAVKNTMNQKMVTKVEAMAQADKPTVELAVSTVETQTAATLTMVSANATTTTTTVPDTTTPAPTPAPAPAHHNIMWILLDDISTEILPHGFNSNPYLADKLPGIYQLKMDGAITYPNFYSSASMCAPAQTAFMSGMHPGNLGGQHQFATDTTVGKSPYAVVPPPEVLFITEYMRQDGYYATGGGKLDFQVADAVPTFFDRILGGGFTDLTKPSVIDNIWKPAQEMDKPFFSIWNIMDHHEVKTQFGQEAPVELTDPFTGMAPNDTTFSMMGPPLSTMLGKYGYTRPASLKWSPDSMMMSGINISMGTSPATGQPFCHPMMGCHSTYASMNMSASTIIGYMGGCVPAALSHADGSLPAYVVEDNVTKAVLCRNYDLVRNADWRINKLIQKMKADGVYNDTTIFVIGDHGSGNYKGKGLMQRTSMYTPLWVKYATGMAPSQGVTTGADGYLEDPAFYQIEDILPTVLSLLNKSIPAHIDGKPFAGASRVQTTDRRLYFTGGRITGTNTKAYSTIKGNWQYTVYPYSGKNVTSGNVHLSAESILDGALSPRPMFDHMRMALKADFEGFKAAHMEKIELLIDEPGYPLAALYDLVNDPWTMTNLLYTYDYSFNATTKDVHVAYTARNLSAEAQAAHDEAKSALETWVDGLTHATMDLHASGDAMAEENELAELFWPGGVQPQTAAPVCSPASGHSSTEGFEMTATSATPGALVQMAALAADQFGMYEYIRSSLTGANSAPLSPASPGFVAEMFTPKAVQIAEADKKNMSGFLWSAASGRPLNWVWFAGFCLDSYVFLKEDLTYMEVGSIDCAFYMCFDTRDATWNGSTWVGLDANGTWTGTPLTLWNSSSSTWNGNNFVTSYIGPNREALAANGGVSTAPPKYWWSPSREPSTPHVLSLFGVPQDTMGLMAGSFNTENVNVMDKGSMELKATFYVAAVGITVVNNVNFESFGFSRVPNDLKTTAHVAPGATTVITQAARKGYADTNWVVCKYNGA